MMKKNRLIHPMLFLWPIGAGLALSLSAGETDSPKSNQPQDEKTAVRPELMNVEDEAALLRLVKTATPRDKAIQGAIDFLQTQQNPDGSFGKVHQVALTGLSVMALMATGHSADDSPMGKGVQRGIHFVLSKMDETGYLGAGDTAGMYAHGIGTLMLLEAVGVTKNRILERRIIEQCRRAVQVILNAQAITKHPSHQGGWRYQPTSADSDLSLTGWQTMALRAAKDIGFDVPEAAVNSAVSFIQRSAGPAGGFGYQAPTDFPALRGVGLLALPICGVYDAPVLKTTTALELRDPPTWKSPHFYYRVYYSSVGMYQMGDKVWNSYFPILDDLLLKHQNADGSWPIPPGNHDYGPAFTTAMSVLALSVHYHLLPIYQR